MPRHLAPNHSGVHRLACLSLYHALLSSCRRVFVGDSKAIEIRNLITNRFRNDRGLQSTNKIANALKAGHEALDLFRGYANGAQNSIQRLNDILDATRILQQQAKNERAPVKTRPTGTKPVRKPKLKRAQTGHQACGTHSILSRPRLKVSGRRRVPVLVNARGVPFLRIKKPQPAFLSLTIRGLLNTRWKRILKRERLELELHRAREEDIWDDITGHKEQVTWEIGVNDSLKAVSEQILAKDRANKELAQKMWEVVLKERALAKKEAMEMKEKQNEQTTRPNL